MTEREAKEILTTRGPWEVHIIKDVDRIRFENKESGETVLIKQFIIGYTPRELRR